MKRKSTALLLSLLLLLALCVPALAAIEYGVFYDETEQLGSVELSYAAEQTLLGSRRSLASICGWMPSPTRMWMPTRVPRTLRHTSMRIPVMAAVSERKASR